MKEAEERGRGPGAWGWVAGRECGAVYYARTCKQDTTDYIKEGKVLSGVVLQMSASYLAPSLPVLPPARCPRDSSYASTCLSSLYTLPGDVL